MPIPRLTELSTRVTGLHFLRLATVAVTLQQQRSTPADNYSAEIKRQVRGTRILGPRKKKTFFLRNRCLSKSTVLPLALRMVLTHA